MTTNVTSIFGGPTGHPEVDENCVSTLEELLEKARAGEIIAVAVAAKHCDGLATANHGGKVAGYALIGALEMIKSRLIEFNNDPD